MTLNARGIFAAIILSFSTPLLADNNFGLGIKAGTLGAGLEATWRPVPYLDLRAGGYLYDYERTGDYAGINYDGTIAFDSLYATANFRFPLSPFRVTAGVYSNSNQIDLVSLDGSSFDVGGLTFTSAEVGTMSSTVTFDKTAPYVGVGYDFSLFGKVGMNIDLGMLWQGEPQVTLAADGLLSADPTFQAALAAERDELQSDIKDYKAWPVVALGFVFNF